MERLVERDSLAQEIARVKAEVARLEFSLPAAASDRAFLAEHLLRTNAQEALELDDKHNGDALAWTDPLPVPYELEHPARLSALLRASSEVFSGLNLYPLAKGADATWTLRGDVADEQLMFEVTFSVADRRVSNLQVSVTDQVQDPIGGLVALATSRNCLRTLLAGLAEYGALFSARQAAFEHVQQELGAAACERASLNSLRLLGAGKRVVVVWDCDWATWSSSELAGEFIKPYIVVSEFDLGPGATKDAQTKFRQSADAFGALIRLCGGFAAAAKVLHQAMLGR